MGDFKVDLERYGGFSAFLREQSIYSIFIYRLGRCIDRVETRILKKIFSIFYFFLFKLFESFLGISIPKEAVIGRGLRIWHFGQIFINSECIIGNNCTLRQGVTIGSRFPGGGSPKIGDNVDFGANSMVLGEIEIGDNVIIGAMSMVIHDVPSNSTVIGIPAKVFAHKKIDDV
jgi:serine O-acetyltransferase